MGDRILVLLEWSAAHETVKVSVGGHSMEFDPAISAQIRKKVFPYGRKMVGENADAQAWLLRDAANVVIAPLEEAPR